MRHTGGWGIKFSGARECDVRGCDLYDLGEGGISMAGGDRKTLTPSGNAADNNHICEYGKELSFYRPGVRLGGVGAKATHNLIHHADHQAISFTGNDHLVAYNVIHDVCRDTDDAGAIYTFARHDWSERGTIVEYNAIHMTGTQPRAHHVYGIYFDNHCSGNVARGNIISRVPTGIWASGGHSTVVEKNVIVNAQVPWARGNYGKPKTFPYLKRGRRGNLFLSVLRNPDCPERTLLEHYPELAKILAVEDDQLAQAAIFTRFAANCYAASGHPMYRDWKVTGPYTTLSGNAEITGDPGFVDYRGFDWRLKPDSPVSKVTGGDCRFEKMGLYDDPLRVSKAVKFAADVSPPRPLDRCPEPSKPGIRLGVLIRGKMAKGEKAFALDFDGCQPEGAGRILATAGTPPLGQWREYSFSFVPDRDCTVDFEVEGSCGEKTLYDDFRAVGVEIAEPSFEQEGCWRLLDKPTAYYPPEKYDAPRFPIVNRDPPHGITGALAGLEGEIRPADGSKMGAANRDWRLVQKLELRKDVPVKIWLKARAYIPPDN
ncbi:MAG: right-handed parallel beta-helix repeat-containing protein [Lentisphaerae bacterium]|nr:right-handed parallel beta-helix repeat-containing protein [Lentisphaerota bacterium]